MGYGAIGAWTPCSRRAAARARTMERAGRGPRARGAPRSGDTGVGEYSLFFATLHGLAAGPRRRESGGRSSRSAQTRVMSIHHSHIARYASTVSRGLDTHTHILIHS